MCPYKVMIRTLTLVLGSWALAANGNGQPDCHVGFYDSGRGCVACPRGCAGEGDLCDKTTGKCTRGCDDYKWGSTCDQLCSTSCKGNPRRCDQDTGRCTDGCIDGWWGETCGSSCSYNCKGNPRTCDRDTGRCPEGCYDSYWGDQCDRECSSHCRGGQDRCDRKNGTCESGCDDGWTGSRCACSTGCVDSLCDERTSICAQGCTSGYWGNKCDQTCSSSCAGNSPTTCDRATGECLNGCKDGWWGKNCGTVCHLGCLNSRCNQSIGYCTDGCKAGFWGSTCDLACSSNCAGQAKICERNSGKCSSGCNIGWRGDKCDTSCKQGCRESGCDQESGECTRGCDAGYWGRPCDSCPQNCKRSRNECDKNSGECLDGCEDGWSGEQCKSSCPQTCLNSRCNQYSGVCASGCKSGYYGEYCRSQCPANCSPTGDICDSTTGQCLHGCKLGYWGNTCDRECPANCAHSCDAGTGHCTSCVTGRWGDTCRGQCNSNCKDRSCHQSSGDCTRGCFTGYWRNSCTERCNPHCKYDACDRQNGYCTYGCDAGHWGDKCENTCSSGCQEGGDICNSKTGACICKPGYWGYKCDQTCNRNCLTSTCDRYNGHCTDGCRDGYWRSMCDQKCSSTCTACARNDGNACHGCPVGYWGSNCKSDCPDTCKEDVCNQEVGACSRGCKSPVLWGDFCDKACGENCDNQECDSYSGQCLQCDTGYWGDFCNTECSRNCVGQTCNKKNGTCTQGCLEGHWGYACEEDCNIGCKGDVCIQSLGECVQGCKHGGPSENWYTGDLCSTVIPADVHVTNLTVEYENSTHVYLSWSSDVLPELYQFYQYELSYGTEKYELDISQIEWHAIRSEPNHDSNQILVQLVRRLKGDGQVISHSVSRIEVVSWAESGSSTAGKIAGTTIGMILLLIAAITGVYIFLRRRKLQSLCNREGGAENDYIDIPMRVTNGQQSGDGREAQTVSGGTQSRTTRKFPRTPGKKVSKDKQSADSAGKVLTTCILVNTLEKYRRDKGEDGLKREYERLEEGCVRPATIASLETHRPRNRYRNILPYDSTRVVLDISDATQTDYINACYIKNSSRKTEKAYVASQGPNKNTIVDMWRMIWQIGSVQVVMVTQCVEHTRIKCDVYWPENFNEPKEYGSLSVTLTNETKFADYSIKTFRMKKGGAQRVVHHFHYLTWPDKTPPQQPFTMIEFRNKIRSYDDENAGPMLVHCSAGVGRTGTLIALDILLDMMKEEEKVDVFEVVRSLREDRMNMVQTEQQYLFLYDALLDQYTCPSDAITNQEFSMVYKTLDVDKGVYYNETTLEQQFTMVCQVTRGRKPNKAQAKYSGHSKINVKRNFSSKIIPDDDHRVKLFDCGGASDYINAVLVQTYTQLNGLIVTQIPLHKTVEDFWSMVLSYKCPCMILINDGQITANFKPTNKNQSATYGKVVVSCEEETTMQGQLTTSDFTVGKEGADQQLTFRIIQLFWSDKKNTPDTKQVVAALDLLTEAADGSQNTGPPVIMCRDGYTQSGLLATGLHIKQRLQIDRDVNINNSVRSVAAYRRQFIPNIGQFRFLFDLALFLGTDGDIYANV